MKKTKNLWLILTACLFIASCGSTGCGQQADATPQEATAQNTAALQEVSAQNTAASQEQPQIQTDWDGTSDEGQDTPDILTDPPTPAPKPEDGDGSKYQADFLGNDSNNITSCILYHDGKKEALNLSTAKGKYFIQMLSSFFGEYESGYCYFDGGMDLKWLEEVSAEKPENYYIKLQIEDPVAMSFEEIYPKSQKTRIVEGYDTLIIEANIDPECDYLTLFWNDGTDMFWGIAPNTGMDPTFMENFQAKYKEWEETTDWDAAFANMANSAQTN